MALMEAENNFEKSETTKYNALNLETSFSFR